ncbi:AraC-like DNA-binding protein [Prauserella sediminis]|uniref:AraC-like DNA-binding protein n=1 Tax=Prauserella sediminis TaxID=577680 RepID=A0A839XD15_9PSEU|nr:AraC family transcriptional regulator [Prauserella sediminis]MBB3661160.1 AraC-like DNA-binding protein [Prauserella sediminis]
MAHSSGTTDSPGSDTPGSDSRDADSPAADSPPPPAGSDGVVGGTRQLRTMRADGTPVYRHRQPVSMPAVAVNRLGPTASAAADAARDTPGPPEHRHAHDFLVLTYVEADAGAIEVDGASRPLRAGEVHALLPGQVVKPVVTTSPAGGRAWSVSFVPDAVPALASVSPLSWTRHPLLSLFAPQAGVALVPEPDRDRWSRHLADLAAELAAPERLGAREAVTSLLTRVLVDAARLAPRQPDTRDALVERVFDRIEETFREPISTADVAAALGYTPGHLTTLVRERTGRPLLEWITERRLTEVRRLLRETDLPLGVVAARTGLRDASYLVRRFRGHYGVTPQRWREAQTR